MTWKPNVTVAAVVERHGRFLLVRERDGGSVVLNQPAGHLEQGESLLQAVARETLEETGREFEAAGLVGVYRYPSEQQGLTYLRFCFHGHCSAADPERTLDPDILDTLWLTPGELATRTESVRSPLVRRCLDDYLAGRRYPLSLLTDLA